MILILGISKFRNIGRSTFGCSKCWRSPDDNNNYFFFSIIGERELRKNIFRENEAFNRNGYH